MLKSTQATPLVVAFITVYAVSTLISMATMSLGAALALIAVILAQISFKSLGESALLKRYLWISIGLSLACLLSLVMAKIHPLYYGSHSVQIHWTADLFKLWYLFFPLLLALVLETFSKLQREHVLRVWLLAAGALSVMGVFQHFTGWPRELSIPRPAGLPIRYHVVLFLGHHLSVASIWIFPTFVALDLATQKQKTSILPRSLAAALAGLGLLVLILTYSRMAWISVPIGVFLLMSFRFYKRTVLSAMVACLLLAIPLYQIPMVKDRVSSVLGFHERILLWEANLDFFKHRPLVGVGWKKTQELSAYYFEHVYYPGQLAHLPVQIGHAHNNFLEMLAGTGALGALAWLAWNGWIFYLCWKLLRQKPETPLVRGFMVAWITFHLNGLTQVNFWEGKVLHQLMWSVAWLLYLGMQNLEKNLKPQ